ncbi:MAG: GNAT family N-acetyltransferase [Gammaproteobacteria bacterium]|nr:GNAT family N-acetyltransferase [Gammaproteobacteria bacterium]
MLKKLVRALLGDYSLYRIFEWRAESSTGHASNSDRGQWRFLTDLDRERLRNSEIIEFRQFANFGDEGFLFALEDDAGLACVCWHSIAAGGAHGGYWPLDAGEGMLEQIVTAPGARGKGGATSLIQFSTEAMMAKGFPRLFARIWHNHAASCRAFEKAGWHFMTLVVEIPLPLSKVVRWQRNAGQRVGFVRLLNAYEH